MHSVLFFAMTFHRLKNLSQEMMQTPETNIQTISFSPSTRKDKREEKN